MCDLWSKIYKANHISNQLFWMKTLYQFYSHSLELWIYFFIKEKKSHFSFFLSSNFQILTVLLFCKKFLKTGGGGQYPLIPPKLDQPCPLERIAECTFKLEFCIHPQLCQFLSNFQNSFFSWKLVEFFNFLIVLSASAFGRRPNFSNSSASAFGRSPKPTFGPPL